MKRDLKASQRTEAELRANAKARVKMVTLAIGNKTADCRTCIGEHTKLQQDMKRMQRQVKASQAKKQTLKNLKLKALLLEDDKNRWRDKFQEKEQKLQDFLSFFGGTEAQDEGDG